MKVAAPRFVQLRRAALKESSTMNSGAMMHAVLSAGLLPPTRPLVRMHLLQIAALMGGQGIDKAQAMGACVLLPQCGVLLVGTACRAPLLQPEADVAATVTGMTILLLRIDVDHGMSVDIRLAGEADWLCNYWLEYSANGLSLVPPREGQSHFCLSAEGVTENPPYAVRAFLTHRPAGVAA